MGQHSTHTAYTASVGATRATIRHAVSALTHGPLAFQDPQLSAIVGVTTNREAIPLVGGGVALSLNDLATAMSIPLELGVFEHTKTAHEHVLAAAERLCSPHHDVSDLMWSVNELESADRHLAQALHYYHNSFEPAAPNPTTVTSMQSMDGWLIIPDCAKPNARSQRTPNPARPNVRCRRRLLRRPIR